MDDVARSDDPATLGELTGVRSSKHSFYPEYRRSNERLTRTVQALDEISQALVRSAEGPRALVEAVVTAAAEHLQARWLLLAISGGRLAGMRPGQLLYHHGRLIDREQDLPGEVREHLATVRDAPRELESCSIATGLVRAPMMLEEEPVGGIVALAGPQVQLADTDLAIIRVLANQAAVALYNAHLFQTAAHLRGRADQLTAEASRQAEHLVQRQAELEDVQQRLTAAIQRQVIDEERHRIARELHDSVTQAVLSAGMIVEVCRSELEGVPGPAGDVAHRLAPAKELTQQAVSQLRSAIYALHNASDEAPGSLPVLLERLSHVHLPTEVEVSVRVAGEPVALPPAVEHSMLRLTGEALFNTATHANAARAVVDLHYSDERVVLSVADDGTGDPEALQRALLTGGNERAGHHCGLANMAGRAEEMGGELSIRRADLGGVLVHLAVPLPLAWRDWR
ncbi:two-component system sensor histidine kinase MnoS [Salinifilum aidingensis]